MLLLYCKYRGPAVLAGDALPEINLVLIPIVSPVTNKSPQISVLTVGVVVPIPTRLVVASVNSVLLLRLTLAEAVNAVNAPVLATVDPIANGVSHVLVCRNEALLAVNAEVAADTEPQNSDVPFEVSTSPFAPRVPFANNPKPLATDMCPLTNNLVGVAVEPIDTFPLLSIRICSTPLLTNSVAPSGRSMPPTYTVFAELTPNNLVEVPDEFLPRK